MALFKRSTKTVTAMPEGKRDESLADLFETVHYDDDPDLGQEPVPVAAVANKYRSK